MKSKNIVNILLSAGNQEFVIDGAKLNQWLVRRGLHLEKSLSNKEIEQKKIVNILDKNNLLVGIATISLRQSLGK